MQFLVIGRDGTDDRAVERRSAVRQEHIALGYKMEESGNRWYGSVLLDNDGKMIGSMAVMDFPSEKEMQDWLDKEPYVTGKVWEHVEVIKCNVKQPWKFNRSQEWFEDRAKE